MPRLDMGRGFEPPHPLIGCGYARHGDAPVGGLTWLDWAEEFAPIPGIHQIVGHSKGDANAVVAVSDNTEQVAGARVRRMRPAEQATPVSSGIYFKRLWASSREIFRWQIARRKLLGWA